MEIQFTRCTAPAGLLADAEVRFTEGPLAGLTLVGFQIWEARGGRILTLPARQYSVNGERRSYALLRTFDHELAGERLRAWMLGAFADFEEQTRRPV